MIKYYLSFTDYQGNTFTADGSPLYAITDFGYSSLQTLNIGSQGSGAGAGKVTFNPLSFTLASDQLTDKLDQMLASGTPFAQVNLVGYETGPGGQPVEVVHDVFKLAAVKSDTVDIDDGLHTFSLEYGGLVESTTPLSASGAPGKTVTAGWNAVQNIADNSLTTEISPTGGAGGSVSLPTFNPAKAVAAPVEHAPGDTFVRFIGANGAVLGGGWIQIDSADFSLVQTLNIGSAGAGAGKVAFDPLTLNLPPSLLDPTLLQLEASGTEIKQIDVAEYSPAAISGGDLVADYRFNLTAIKSNDFAVSNGVSTDTYSFEYGDEQIATFAPGSSTPTVEGWSSVKNTSDTTYSLGTVPTTEASIHSQLANLGDGGATKYYLTFTDSQGNTFTMDGSPLYQITNFDISSLQTLNIGSQTTGAGAGKITFNPLTFTLASDKLTEQLDQMLASGTPYAQVNLVGYDTTGGKPVQVLHDVFKLAAVKSDSIDVVDGLHNISMEYGGLVESVKPLQIDGTLGTAVTAGWNRVANAADASLTSTIVPGGGSGSVSLPTLDPTKAVAAPNASTKNDAYVRFLSSTGATIGGGWVAVGSGNFSLLQTLNIGSQTTGAGAGKVTFNPLSLTFAPGSLEPTLLQLEASGTEIKQIDVAAYASAGGALVQDYRFGVAGIASSDDSVSDGVATQTYTFEYGSEQVATYVPGVSTPSVDGWNRVTNVADTSFSLGTVPTTEASLHSQLAPVVPTQTDQTKYYLTFTDYQGHTFTADGSPLYQVTDVDLSTLQTLNIGSQGAGTGAGKITFNPLTFTLASDKLTLQLDQVLASGTPFAQVNLVGYDTGQAGQPVQVLHDVFKLAAVKSDTITADDGLHQISMEYGGLVESSTPLTVSGAPGTTVTQGWNAVSNITDNNLTSVIGSGGVTSVTLPTLDPTKAIAPASASKTGDVFVHFTGSTGAELGGGWFKVDAGSFSLLQTLNIGSQTSGAGAGKVTFNPLALTFAPGTFGPTLLQMEASGTAFKTIDVVTYGNAGGGISQDYRFTLAAIKSIDDSATNGVSTDAYTFEYGSEQIANFTTGLATPTIQGWDRVTNVSDTGFSLGSVPTTETQVRGELACYCAGARLRTDRGDIAVEALQVGDRLVTISGEAKPVVWIGRRRYACADHPEPGNVWPVVVAAGAFGEASPSRDLWLSPGHSLFVDGRLVQAVRLVNGTTIRQVSCDFVDYWHVELDRHDIVYAEGLEAETYLDTGNRANFEGGAALALHPNFGPNSPDATCAPFLEDGPPLAALRAKLFARARSLGFSFDAEPDLHALADGQRIEPIRLRADRFAFVFPDGVRHAALASRTWRPMDALTDNRDGRRLGVCVGRLQIDGLERDLAEPAFSDGWSYFEPEAAQRWTAGSAALPAGVRIAVVDLAGEGLYASAPDTKALSGAAALLA